VGERAALRGLPHNPQEAAKDAADRETMLAALQDKLRQGAQGLVGNRGFRRFLKVEKGAVSLNQAAVKAEARFDGKYVLRTNTKLPAAEVAVQYQRLLLVEQFFRAAKSLLDPRPIFHQWDATIKGHVFCLFLALVLLDELKRRLAKRGVEAEWADIRRDLLALAEVEVRDDDTGISCAPPFKEWPGKSARRRGKHPAAHATLGKCGAER
jgi:hypothetical protein